MFKPICSISYYYGVSICFTCNGPLSKCQLISNPHMALYGEIQLYFVYKCITPQCGEQSKRTLFFFSVIKREGQKKTHEIKCLCPKQIMILVMVDKIVFIRLIFSGHTHLLECNMDIQDLLHMRGFVIGVVELILCELMLYIHCMESHFMCQRTMFLCAP